MLHVIRHGKAERDSETGRDFDRPLAARGERQAAWLGSLLAGFSPRPGRVLTSPAVRTRQTAERIALALHTEPEPAAWLSLETTLSAAAERVSMLEGPAVLVGHEPTVSGIIELLVTGSPVRSGLTIRTGECVSLSQTGPGWTVRRTDRYDG
ncbi:MAG: histidine phosphatase family protein [Planctomycetota bacterium]